MMVRRPYAESLVRSEFGLGFFRLLLGIGEAGNFMASFKAILQSYPAD